MMDELFRSAAARLADFPLLGKPGQAAGHARSFIVYGSYRLIYEVIATNVSRRRWIASAAPSIAGSLATSVSPLRAVSRNQFEPASASIASRGDLDCKPLHLAATSSTRRRGRLCEPHCAAPVLPPTASRACLCAGCSHRVRASASRCAATSATSVLRGDGQAIDLDAIIKGLNLA
jgi:hypothetical protein